MNTEIQPFEFENNQVRAMVDGDEVMFVASDIAKILGYRDAANLTRTLDDDEKGTHEVSTPRSGIQTMTVLTEPGLYRAILNREIAYVKEPESQTFVKRFQRWVTHEVLPSIRKHSAYMTQQTIDKTLANPDFLIQLATKLKEEQEKVKALEPKAKALDTFTDVEDKLLIRDAAKILSNAGTPISEKRLREWMTANNWIYKDNGSWHATAKHCTAGHLTMVMSTKYATKSDGTKFAFPPTVRITRKGLTLLHRCLADANLGKALEITTTD
nr:MAG: antirepressor protein KilAC domain [Bacteriophage sp.]